MDFAHVCVNNVQCMRKLLLDIGWGYTHTDALGTPRAKGRHRPAKPRKGRALKGNKRAKGKSGRAGWEDEEDVNGTEAPLVNLYGQPPGVPLPAPVVEGLFGWQWPLTAQELARCVTTDMLAT